MPAFAGRTSVPKLRSTLDAECWQVVEASRSKPAGLDGRLESEPMQPYLWQFFVMAFAGWVNRFQQDAIEYLKVENRVLREQLGGRRLRFTDGQRRRLAAKARTLGRDGRRKSRIS